MCGRVFIKTSLGEMLRAFAFAKEEESVSGLANEFPRFNGAPGRDYPIIVRDVVGDGGRIGPVWRRALWGFRPAWSKAPKPGDRPPPINARGETVATNGMFKDAYRRRRALLPIAGGYFEWQDIHGTGKNKQPYAIAMADESPFCMAAIWETWRDRETNLELRTFAIVTCAPNSLMATIHDRMPVILHPEDYARWLSDDPDPGDLIKPYPSELMKMWKIGRDVGSPKNDRPDIIYPLKDDLFD